MTKVTKALLVAFGSAGLVGTGFAAWNITISDGAAESRTVTPNTDGNVTLVAQGLVVTGDPTLTFHADTGTQIATYNVKAEDAEWYDNIDRLDASDDKVALKVSFAGEADGDWGDYIVLSEAVERVYTPSQWLTGFASSGFDVSFTFNWKAPITTNPKEYAQATYPTPEAQKAYLDGISAAVDGLKFTFTFDLVANDPVTPPTPVVESVTASLSSESIEVGNTSNLTVSTNLGTPSSYTLVDKSANFDEVVSFSDGVFTGLSAGVVTFKVEVDSVQSVEKTLTVSAPVVHAVTAVVEDSIHVLESTSAMMVDYDGDEILPSGFSIVDQSEGFNDVVSYNSSTGVFTGVGVGTATFKVQVESTKSDLMTINVSAATVEAIVLEDEIEVNDTTDLLVYVNGGSDEYDGAIELVNKSANFDEVVSFNNRTFTGLAAGEVSFKVSVGGGLSDLITLTVNAAAAPVINYGTAESPLSVSDALTTIGELNLGSNEWSQETFYITGKVKATPGTYQTYWSNTRLVDPADSSKEFLIYTLTKVTDEVLYPGDTVTVHGYVQNYNGTTLEMQTHSELVPAYSNLIRGTSTITVSCDEHATATLTSGSYTNGSVQTFSVGVDDSENYEIDTVTGATATGNNDNEYSFTVSGDATIAISSREKGTAPQVVANFTDVLDQSVTSVTGTNYANFSDKSPNGYVTYGGQCAGDKSSIQLRSNNNNSGVVTTANTTGNKARSITVVWHADTAAGRTLNIYGSDTAYTAPTQLYGSSVVGTLLGTIVKGTSTSLTITGNYSYIGFRSASGAMYLTSVSIVWGAPAV